MPAPHLSQQGRLIPGQCQKLTSRPTPWVQPEQLIAACQPISKPGHSLSITFVARAKKHTHN